ncbi:3-ketoacyl-CoA thiolase 2, peroxisomal-like isoform X1 [Miscanthus floridulus]|uniref:3-ketoacyl-CoA thiolase 2, peroxisomal-like isoform X1 n=1 Tax=Miscanthus floridulus TaxID=154761 RepID=UPI0034588390
MRETLFVIFFEEINHGGAGGLWAELVDNRACLFIVLGKYALGTRAEDDGGNSSQVSDAAGAVLVMKSSVAQKKGLPILSVFRSFIAVGVGPAVMGVGPAVAIPAAVKSAGLEIGDIDMFELNVAFASQFVYCCNKLGLDRSKVNVNGDTIALGHPLVATGSRCVALRSVKLNSYSKTSLKSTQ